MTSMAKKWDVRLSSVDCAPPPWETRSSDKLSKTTMKLAQEYNPHYNPSNLLNFLQKLLSCKNDAQLARLLEISAPAICKIRRRNFPIAASLLIRMHEVTNMSITDLRKLAGDFRAHTGRSAHHPSAAEISTIRKFGSVASTAVSAQAAR